MRGINRQDIFEEQEDYVRMLKSMQQMLEPYDELGNRQPPLCTFYAYCLMSNHVHLLLKTNQETIGSTVKHLSVMYAHYFNRKYSRAGHLFQDRFKSEPVNNIEYFVTLLRYIHQNPVKSGMVESVEDYPWSSWGEYIGTVPSALGLCATNVVTKRVGYDTLKELVESPLSEDVHILDIAESPRQTIGDRSIRQLLEETYGITDSIKVQELEKSKRNEVLQACLSLGAGYRQLSRLTGVPYGVIHRMNNQKNKGTN